jgi:mono/diheme cytochrome c family protein
MTPFREDATRSEAGQTRRGFFRSVAAAALALASAALRPLSAAAAASPSPLPGDPARGKQLFLQHGAPCHGVNLEGGVGPRLNPIAKLPGVSDPLDPAYLINVISNGLPGGMPAWKQQGLSDQDIGDIAAFIIQENRSHQAVGLSPQELAQSDVFWVAAGTAIIAGFAYVLSRYNMRWIARRAAVRRERASR